MHEHHDQAVFWRHDTFLGVCEAIGRDFGFNPNWLRVLFALALLPSPAVTLGAYLGLGLLVFVSRRLFPVPARADTAQVAAPALAAAAAETAAENDEIELARAA